MLKALAVSADGTVLIYQLNKLVVAAEVKTVEPRRVYYSGLQLSSVNAGSMAEASQMLLAELPSDVLGATVGEGGVQFLRA